MLTLEEVKTFLRIEHDEEDAFLEQLISASEFYIYNATGSTHNTNPISKLLRLTLISDWYENRTITDKSSEKVRFIINSMIAQLKYSGDQ